MYYVINPKTNEDVPFRSLDAARDTATILGIKYNRAIHIYDKNGIVETRHYTKGKTYKAPSFAKNPSRLTNAARKASYYFDDPRTGERKFDTDMDRLKRSAARIANEIGQAIGIFTAAATGPTRKGKRK